MNGLHMNFEETVSVGKQLGTQNEEFRRLLGEIKNANNALKSYWKGLDANKYTNAVDEQAKNMDDLAVTMDEISNFIFQAAKVIEETQASNASSINIG